MATIRKLRGANMDIDLANPDTISCQDSWPWNVVEGTAKHKCAVKNVSLCRAVWTTAIT